MLCIQDPLHLTDNNKPESVTLSCVQPRYFSNLLNGRKYGQLFSMWEVREALR